MKRQPVSTLATATVQKVFNRYQAAARAVVEDANPDELSDPDLMIQALHQYSDGQLENIAREAANQAFKSGRADGLEQAENEAGANLVWRRGSVLEESTCGPCGAADGSEIDGPDEDLSEICEGGDLCRCISYAEIP